MSGIEVGPYADAPNKPTWCVVGHLLSDGDARAIIESLIAKAPDERSKALESRYTGTCLVACRGERLAIDLVLWSLSFVDWDYVLHRFDDLFFDWDSPNIAYTSTRSWPVVPVPDGETPTDLVVDWALSTPAVRQALRGVHADMPSDELRHLLEDGLPLQEVRSIFVRHTSRRAELFEDLAWREAGSEYSIISDLFAFALSYVEWHDALARIGLPVDSCLISDYVATGTPLYAFRLKSKSGEPVAGDGVYSVLLWPLVVSRSIEQRNKSRF